MSGVRKRALAWMATALAGALQGYALAQPMPSDEAVPNATAGETSVAAPLSESERMMVSVTIAGTGPYPFIVDTAAESTVIASDLARDLNLQPAGRRRMVSMTSTRTVAKVHVPDVSFLLGRTQDLEAFTLNGQNVGAAGILGIDALRHQRVVLDFETQTLHVGPAPRRRRVHRAEPGEIVVRARRRLGQLVLVDCTIDGHHVDVIVDSGTQISVGNQALRRLMTTRHNKFDQITLISVTGEFLTADYTRSDRLVIGRAAVVGMPVAFARAPFFAKMKMTRRPALLLGMDALQMFARVSVDFANLRAYFVLPDDVQRSAL